MITNKLEAPQPLAADAHGASPDAAHRRAAHVEHGSTASAGRRARSSSRPIVRRAIVDSLPQARPAPPGPEPRHVRRRGRQRPDDGPLRPGARRHRARRRPGFILAVSLWLWFTVLFANFAEAMAEGRGKAQADSLRKARKDIHGQAARRAAARRARRARRRLASSARATSSSSRPATSIPCDGEIVEGVASVDESAITGESAPVIRESGGDRSAVTGGTRVLSDWLIVRITANPGETFLDRMIAMVEGAKRQKTPNEIALDILLAALTIIFLLATVTLLPYSLFSVDGGRAGHARHDHGARRAARLPDPDDDRRPALGHRHRRHGPHDPGERHRDVAAARSRPPATSTCSCSTRRARSRSATARRPRSSPRRASTERGPRRRRAARSLADETPEGRSIVVLAKEKYGIRERDVHALERDVRAVHRADAHERRRPRRPRDPQGRGRRDRGVRRRPRAARSRADVRARVDDDRQAGRHAARRRRGREGARRRSSSRTSSRAASRSASPSSAAWASRP